MIDSRRFWADRGLGEASLEWSDEAINSVDASEGEGTCGRRRPG
jgi:hypothetical protein